MLIMSAFLGSCCNDLRMAEELDLLYYEVCCLFDVFFSNVQAFTVRVTHNIQGSSDEKHLILTVA